MKFRSVMWRPTVLSILSVLVVMGVYRTRAARGFGAFRPRRNGPSLFLLRNEATTVPLRLSSV